MVCGVRTRSLLQCGAVITWAVAIAILTPDGLGAQTLRFRLGPIDMHGGAVLASESEPGVAFGARVGLADVFRRALLVGVELDWWTAQRDDMQLEVRDVVVGIAVWRELASRGALRPFLGLGAAVHSVHASGEDGSGFLQSREAAELDGYRLGASGFAGLSMSVSHTGAIWVLLEYCYAAVRRVPHHELRAGVRLLPSGL
ncbi:MAG: hypothetical protein AMS25_00310 [Gemmatimonas sp. SM23_52]|nr:MAG: hypothetical protein AMS25_00310 [Gemmatimonas sp. SM23_52]